MIDVNNLRGIVEGKENMERLTERTGEGQAIPRMDLKNNGHQRCMERLAECEDFEEIFRSKTEEPQDPQHKYHIC